MAKRNAALAGLTLAVALSFATTVLLRPFIPDRCLGCSSEPAARSKVGAGARTPFGPAREGKLGLVVGGEVDVLEAGMPVLLVQFVEAWRESIRGSLLP